MPPVSLALYWHQHQPYYPDDVAGDNPMPWVRLHGTKDYIGMALHLREVPEFRCTINLVPSLLTQILGYTDRDASDRHLDVSRMPADGLSEADAHYVLDHFFMANPDNMVRPFPRYAELLDKRNAEVLSARDALDRFTENDLRDLQIWNNLTWFHELLFEEDADLRAFREKGRDWSEDEKHWLLDRQRDVLRRIIPLHRELAESGQVELTTTPFFHPILPLLFDKNSAREAMPHCALPRVLESYEEDAAEQLRRAVAFHEELFGAPPKGMWPSEGSVSQAIVPAIADVGIEWIATDEEILAASTDGRAARNESGGFHHPELLYRPWRIAGAGSELQIVFRDQGLSDLIGFEYQRSDPRAAAEDLMAKVESIGRAVAERNPNQPALVPIILDGENCWEYYPDGGVEFLRTLYRTCATHANVKSVTIGEHLEQSPATETLPRLFAGSWISHNFAIWIGHHEDNTAWDRLHETREFLKGRAQSSDAEALRRAWDELYIAEGSDWFWWYGEDHSSAQDSLFDWLFRRHLKNVYTLLGEHPPANLDDPISRSEKREVHTQPKCLLNVNVTGRAGYFDWAGAGEYAAGSERGTMTKVTETIIRHVHFGFDDSRLLIRCDTFGNAREDLDGIDAVLVRISEPERTELRFEMTSELASMKGAEFACDEIVEIAIPLESLGAIENSNLAFSIELCRDDRSEEQAPAESAIRVTVPSPAFERMNWQV